MYAVWLCTAAVVRQSNTFLGSKTAKTIVCGANAVPHNNTSIHGISYNLFFVCVCVVDGCTDRTMFDFYYLCRRIVKRRCLAHRACVCKIRYRRDDGRRPLPLEPVAPSQDKHLPFFTTAIIVLVLSS